MLNFNLLCFWVCNAQKIAYIAIMLNIMSMSAAIMSQFVYDFIIFND